MSAKRTEVQAHGFSWEKELIYNVYKATPEELAAIGYTDKMDLPAALNHLDGCDVSMKVTCSANAVCMADCLRVFDAVSSGSPLHMTVIHYKQDDATQKKKIVSIYEVNLTGAKELLFGTLSRAQLEELDRLIKSVPQKRSPTPEEHARIYALRDELQKQSAAIHLDPKCNSQQSRLQCSFNRFQSFLSANPGRIVAKSLTNEFRGGAITPEIASGRRTFKKKQTQALPQLD